MDKDKVQDVNTIAAFLAHEEHRQLSGVNDIETIVLCGSAILQCSEAVFAALNENPKLAKTLVIAGGIGHSTQFLYDVVAADPRYKSLSAETQGLAESRVLYRIFQEFYNGARIEHYGLRVLIDDVSTNCGANAIETRKILDKHGVETRKMVIVQDPTMSRRTLATFQHVYSTANSTPSFVAFPSFVPRIAWRNGQMQYDIPELDTDGLWDIHRFCELVLGEIPRMRNDEHGYGPKGKGFIAHVNIPIEVEQAWAELNKVITTQRAATLKPSA